MLKIEKIYNFPSFNQDKVVRENDKRGNDYARNNNIDFYFDNMNLFLLFTNEFKEELLSREFIMNLLILSNQINIEKITLFISNDNKAFSKLLQGILTIGFIAEKDSIDDKYSMFTLGLHREDEEIEEIDF